MNPAVYTIQKLTFDRIKLRFSQIHFQNFEQIFLGRIFS